MEVVKVSSKIIKLIYPTCEEAATAVVRMQEYYESPFDQIRGKIFTLGYLKYLYANSSNSLYNYAGGATHKTPYGGFNLPRSALQPFIMGMFEPLTPAEQDIVELVKLIQNDFYIIVVAENFDAVDHEISHAIWGTCPEYKKQACKILRRYQDFVGEACNQLIDMGYPNDPLILLDEIVAYTGADSGKLGNTPPRLIKHLRTLFLEYKSKEIGNVE
jgi:hypothetical protein